MENYTGVITERKLRPAGGQRTPREGWDSGKRPLVMRRVDLKPRLFSNGGRAEARLESVAHQRNSDIELLCSSVFSPNEQKNVQANVKSVVLNLWVAVPMGVIQPFHRVV